MMGFIYRPADEIEDDVTVDVVGSATTVDRESVGVGRLAGYAGIFRDLAVGCAALAIGWRVMRGEHE